MNKNNEKKEKLNTKEIQLIIVGISCAITMFLSIILNIHKLGFFLIPVLVGFVVYYTPLIFKELRSTIKELTETPDDVVFEELSIMETWLNQEIIEKTEAEIVE